MKRKDLIPLFYTVGAITMIVMSYQYFLHRDFGILRNKVIADSGWYLFAFRIHIAGGLLAISIGAFQLMLSFRKLGLRLHIFLGLIYVGSVMASGTTGLLIAQYAMGGLATHIGFSILAAVWCFFTVKAFMFGRNRDVIRHRSWISRSYALTFAAITQRTLLLVPLITGIEFMPVYQVSAWLPWMFNLSVCEWYLTRSIGKSVAPISINRGNPE